MVIQTTNHRQKLGGGKAAAPRFGIATVLVFVIAAFGLGRESLIELTSLQMSTTLPPSKNTKQQGNDVGDDAVCTTKSPALVVAGGNGDGGGQ